MNSFRNIAFNLRACLNWMDLVSSLTTSKQQPWSVSAKDLVSSSVIITIHSFVLPIA